MPIRGPLFTVASLAVLTAMAAPGSLADRKWRDRVVLVLARKDDPRLAAQQAILARAGDAMRARDVAVVAVVGDDVSGASDPAADLRRRYRVTAGAFAAILIGKDGGEKLRSATPLTVARLEATIDAMPMRRDEMRR